MVGEVGLPVGSWRLQGERLKFPPGEHEGFRSSDMGIAFVARMKRAKEENLISDGMVVVLVDKIQRGG